MSGASQGEVSAVEMMPPSQFLQEAEALPPPPPPPPHDDDSLLQAVMANRHSNPPTSVNASGSDMRLRPYDEGSGEKPRQVDDDNGTGSYPRSQNPLHDSSRRKKAVDEDNASFCDAAGGYYHSKHSEKSDSSWGFDKYVCAIGREVGFSTWFRMYILLLLFSNLLLCVLVGYHFMLAASYRMAAPPEDESKRIPGSFAFLSLFFIILHLASTCLHMTLRLIGCWMGFTRDSCNLFFLPNSFQVPKQSMKWRDFQLFGLALLTLVIPFFYAVAITLGGGDAAPYFFGHFSFCSFAIFNICYLVLYMYFWWKSIRAKKVATSKATVQMKEMQKLDRRDRSDDDEEDDEEEEEIEDEDRSSGRGWSSRRRWRKGRRTSKGTSADGESAVGSHRRRPSMRSMRTARDDDDGVSDASPRITESKALRDESEIRVLWKRRRLANPLLMSEFGLDLFSLQAYVLHVLIGIVWVIVAVYPTGVAVRNILWIVLIFVVVTFSVLMFFLLTVSKSPRKLAANQRKLSVILLVLLVVYNVIAIAAGFAAAPGIGAVVFVGLLLIQGFLVRRHDMHIRSSSEAGSMFLPIYEKDSDEARRRSRYGNPSYWTPIFPCGSLWRTCFTRGYCMTPARWDKDGEKKLAARLQAKAAVNGLTPEESYNLADRDGSNDLIYRPAVEPGFRMPGAESAFVISKRGTQKLAREEYHNVRGRVHQADLQITTLYLLVFLLIIGLTNGFGEWVNPSEGSVAAEPSIAPYAGQAPYAACGLRWGAKGQMTLQDFAFLTYLGSDGAPGEREAALAEWFGTVEMNVTEVPRAAVWKAGTPVRYLEYHVLHGSVSETVFVLGEPKFGASWMRDVDVWGDAVLYQLLAATTPLVALWDTADRTYFVRAMGLVKKLMRGSADVLDDVEAVVRARLEAGESVHISGHGTHGGWAKVLAHKLKGRVSAVSFGPPGTWWTSEKFSAAEHAATNDVSLMPKGSLFERVDRHVGFVQQTTCDDGNSLSKCQLMRNQLCDLLRACGDAQGRVFKNHGGLTACKFDD